MTKKWEQSSTYPVNTDISHDTATQLRMKMAQSDRDKL